MVAICFAQRVEDEGAGALLAIGLGGKVFQIGIISMLNFGTRH
jgi:hypothetical protein